MKKSRLKIQEITVGGVILDPLGTENPGGWGLQIKESSMGGVWIFSGTTHCIIIGSYPEKNKLLFKELTILPVTKSARNEVNLHLQENQ